MLGRSESIFLKLTATAHVDSLTTRKSLKWCFERTAESLSNAEVHDSGTCQVG